jgi:phenylpropionate dioxygenase-like ring-hydroxylating dioxygenase large terminal subunit
VTHASHFRKPGDYRSFTVAGFPFFLILGKDSVIRGFHNVCRHRAYTVTKKPSGSTLVLGCRYHGWSYDTKGKLVKAPHFDDIPGFQKDDNNLFQIWVRPDSHGFVFVNFDAGYDIEDLPMGHMKNFSTNHRIDNGSIAIKSWQVEVNMNWKFVGE